MFTPALWASCPIVNVSTIDRLRAVRWYGVKMRVGRRTRVRGPSSPIGT